MIRMLFVFFVAVGGFATAAVWYARGVNPHTVVDEVVPGAVRAAVEAEAERLGLDVTAILPPAAPEPQAGPEEGRAPDAEPPVARESVATVPEPAADEGPVEVEELEPLRKFSTDLAAESDGSDDDGDDLEWNADTEGPVASADRVEAPPLDDSAALIRRMLTVYRRAGSGR